MSKRATSWSLESCILFWRDPEGTWTSLFQLIFWFSVLTFKETSWRPKETKAVTVYLSDRSFSYYDVKEHDWKIETGKYRISAGFASDDIRLEKQIVKTGTMTPYSSLPSPYFILEDGQCEIPLGNFEKALGHPISQEREVKPFTVNTTFAELRDSFRGKYTTAVMEAVMKKRPMRGVRESMIFEAPIRNVLWFVKSWDTVDAIVDFFNGKGNVISVLARIGSERKGMT